MQLQKSPTNLATVAPRPPVDAPETHVVRPKTPGLKARMHWKTWSIRRVGPVILVAPVIVLTIAFAILARWKNERTVDELSGQIVERIAFGLDRQVATDLQSAVGVVDHTAELITDGVLPADDLASWRPALSRQLDAFHGINAVVFGAANGATTWVIRYPGEETSEYAIHPEPANEEIVEYALSPDGSLGEELGRYEFDARVRPWFRAAKDAGKSTWSEVYPWVRRNGGISTLGIARVCPTYDENEELIGVVSVDVGLGAISEFLRDGQIPEGGVAFLTEPDGALIAASSELPLISPEGGRVFAADVDNPLIARIADIGKIDAAQSRRLHFDDQDFVVRSIPLETPWDFQWTLTLAVPESEFLGGVQDLQRQAWLVGGALALMMLLLGVLLSRALVNPIVRLTDSVRRIGSGDLDTRVDVKGWSEFRVLSDEVNRMTSDLRDRIRLRHSLDVAMEVQQQLLPAATPTVAGIDLAAHSTYCDETGGDYFDFLELGPAGEGELFIVLGDVMGHGIAAALLMATARGFLRSRAATSESLGELLEHVNNLLVADTGGERFMTMLVLVVDGNERSLRWSSAGQDPAIVYSAQQDEFLELEDLAGLPLGIVEQETYPDAKHAGLETDDILIIATDGVWETHSPTGEEFGKDRVRDLIRANKSDSSEAISAALTQALADFRGELKAHDDVTFVVVKFRENG